MKSVLIKANTGQVIEYTRKWYEAGLSDEQMQAKLDKRMQRRHNQVHDKPKFKFTPSLPGRRSERSAISGRQKLTASSSKLFNHKTNKAMSHSNFAERFSQTNARIDKMFWIAGSPESSDLKDLIEEMDDELLAICFPDIKFGFADDRLERLIHHNKYGFIAELHISQCDNFSFIAGKPSPTSWSSSPGRSWVRYAYGESPGALMQEVEKQSKDCFQMDLDLFKKEKQKKS